MTKRLLMLWLLCSLSAYVEAQDFTYTTNNNTITITGYRGTGGAVTIPNTISGLPVASIEQDAFGYGPTSVTIPNSVTNIESGAFFYCISLTTITVDAFNPFFSSLDGVLFNQSQTELIQCPRGKVGGYTIPNCVSNIGDRGFWYCTRLDSVNIPSSVTNIGYAAFESCIGLISITIPNSVTSIGGDAFSYCANLTNVLISTNVTSIGEWAFGSCTNLAIITIPNSVTSIGKQAFFDCDSLTSVTIPDSVTNIGDGAFCALLSTITVAESNAFYCGAAGVLYNKSQTILLQYPGRKTGSSYTIPDGVISIGYQAFARCLNLASITIPNSVTNIDYAAFAGCISLTNITIGNSVASIGEMAFIYCTNLTRVTLGNSVTNIGGEAFSSCPGLREIYFQGNGPSLGPSVFSGATNATVYYLPGTTGWGATFGGRPTVLLDLPYTFEISNNTITITRYTGLGGAVAIPDTITGMPVTTIGDHAFYECTRLTNVTIGNSVTRISYGAFADCTSLAAITIPDSVTDIGYYAFGGCSGLTSVTIPNSVTSIGEEAFGNCTSLTNFTMGNSVTNLGDDVFSDCSSLAAITVDPLNSFFSSLDGVLFDQTRTTLIRYPQGKAGSAYTILSDVINIEKWAFSSADSLTSVTIPNRVASLGRGVFSYCASLASVTISASLTNIGDYAFSSCPSLREVYFQGNAPSLGPNAFLGDTNATIYYLPGTTGWEATFGGRPTMLWNPQALTSDASFGVRENRFGFNITGTSNLVIVVEGCTNLANAAWFPVSTNTLTGGSSYFSDPQWTNYPGCFYRLRTP
jgi:hypothetical protein